MAGIYEKVVGVISKPPEARTERDVKELLPWFCKKSELFASLKSDVLTDIIRNCQFKTLERDSVIIKQGEKGDCFYIILRGTVAIFINNAISDEDDAAKIAERLEEAEKKALDEKGELDRSVFGNYIGKIEAGRSFGELALISKECVRNASIITDETADLIVVNRVLYNRSLRAAQAAEFEERTRFVQDNPLFRYWQPKYKKMMAMSIRKHIVQFDEHIVRQGEPAGDLYFLLRGQAKLVVEPSQHPHQYPSLYPLQDPDDHGTDEEDEFLQVKKKEKEKYNEHERSLIVIAPSATRRKEKPRICHEISLIGFNDIIGDTEFMLDLKTYMLSVVSTQVCHLYALDMKNYERLVVRRNPRTIDMIREHAEVKLMSRVLRLQQENKVPVLRTLLHKLQSINKPPPKRKDKRSSAFMSTSYDFVPQRGALIDIYGPGTVFYRNRQRERIKNKARHKADHFRGAKVGFGLVAPSNLTQNANQPVDQVYQDGAHGYDGELYSDDDHPQDVYEYEEDEYAASSGDESTSSPKGRPAFGYPFVDREGSDKVLSELEERIKAWHAADWDGRSKTSKPKAVKMRRVSVEKTLLKPGAKVVLRKRKPLRPRIIIQADSEGEEGVALNGAHPSLHRESHGSDIENEGAPRASVHRAGVQGAEEAASVALPLHGIHHVQLTSSYLQPTYKPRSTSTPLHRQIRKSVSLPNLGYFMKAKENLKLPDTLKLPNIYRANAKNIKNKGCVKIPRVGSYFAKIYDNSNSSIVLMPSGNYSNC